MNEQITTERFGECIYVVLPACLSTDATDQLLDYDKEHKTFRVWFDPSEIKTLMADPDSWHTINAFNAITDDSEVFTDAIHASVRDALLAELRR